MMAEGPIETEVKLLVPDLEGVAARIRAAGGALTAPRVLERNWRYDTPDHTLTPAGIVLRLRQDTRARLTYKAPGVVIDGALARLEAEVTVSDFEQMDLILRRLGFVPYVIYEKYRTTYRLGEAEIVLDELPYGPFVEIEAPAPVIAQTIAALGLAGYPRYTVSYMALFERVKAALGLEAHDLTFAAFAGITVPPEAFGPGA